MSSYDIKTAIQRWRLGDMTAEQGVGQLFLLVQGLSTRIGELEQTVDGWYRDEVKAVKEKDKKEDDLQ